MKAMSCKESDEMAKSKHSSESFKLKKELPRLPGYLLVVTWVAFTFFMIGWIILATFSTTKENFTVELMDGGINFSK